jgi:2-C-methyl-D-erythritol 4-phosphate cytidylyltransferase
LDKMTAIILAAGQGKRMNSPLLKQFMLLQGMPVIAHTLRAFEAAAVIDELILVCGAGEENYYSPKVLHEFGVHKPVRVVIGGLERQDSVYCGLTRVPSGCSYVLIHDGVRPLVTVDVISRVADAVRETGAVTTGVPVKDTIKRSDAHGNITETLSRSRLWQIQTPQAFRRELIFKAHEEALADGFYGTDDASLIERLGTAVKIVPGSDENLKITTPGDIIIAETILKGRAND